MLDAGGLVPPWQLWVSQSRKRTRLASLIRINTSGSRYPDCEMRGCCFESSRASGREHGGAVVHAVRAEKEGCWFDSQVWGLCVCGICMGSLAFSHSQNMHVMGFGKQMVP